MFWPGLWLGFARCLRDWTRKACSRFGTRVRPAPHSIGLAAGIVGSLCCVLHRRAPFGFASRGTVHANCFPAKPADGSSEPHNSGDAALRSTANDEPSPLPASAVAELKSILGDRLSVDHDDCSAHTSDFAYHECLPPYAVASPCSTDEVSRVLRICNTHRIPVTAVGGGTSLEGQSLPVCRGLLLNMSQMAQVIELHSDDMDITVQAGISYYELNEFLEPFGFFFPLDPGPGASIGGMIGTRCSGTNAVRYGTMRENVLSLTAVLADGTVIRTGQRARKSSAGYDLRSLMIGSEGTLGIVTEATLRLSRLPKSSVAAVCTFPNTSQATRTVISALQAGILLGKAEFMDSSMMKGFNRYTRPPTPFDEVPTVFFALTGSSAAQTDEQAAVVRDLVLANGGRFTRCSDQGRDALWLMRKDALWATHMPEKPDAKVLVTDVCVPISRLADCVEETLADIAAVQASGIDIGSFVVGHVGDGNFHVNLRFDQHNAAETQAAHDLADRMAYRAIAMDGTCTGEHGVGLGKQKFLEHELGANSVNTMRAIKRALDPHCILNPGKVFSMVGTGPTHHHNNNENPISMHNKL